MSAADDFAKRIIVIEMTVNEFQEMTKALFHSGYSSMFPHTPNMITPLDLRERFLNRVTFNGGKIEQS